MVDGPNLYNDVGRLLSKGYPSQAEKEVQLRYFRDWFDIDRLITATLGRDLSLDPWKDLGTVIVHSRKGLGSSESSYSIQGEDVIPFWNRQGSNPNTSTVLVEIAGSRKGEEKGIDTSLVVYLFETVDRWDSSVIFSNDTDFVPAVWSLRRRGKRVYCSSHVEDISRPLVQACQHFIPWSIGFLRADRDLFEFLQPNGTLDSFVRTLESNGLNPTVRQAGAGLRVSVSSRGTSPYSQHLKPLSEYLDNTFLFTIEAGSELILQARDTQGAPSQSAPAAYSTNVAEGFVRHRGLFADAHWYSRYS